MKEFRAILVLLVGCTLLAFIGGVLQASETAIVSGRITDSSGAVIVGAKVDVTNVDTQITSEVETNEEGIYTVPYLGPGRYRIMIQKDGFQTIVKPGVVLHVQDTVSLNFSMQVGSLNQTITVEGGAPLINTDNASVSTVIDRNFVESLPLNGRSFNTLLQLTPGVVITGTGGNVTSPGQFSMGGQRTDANNFSVDGVSANFGVIVAQSLGASGTGTAQAFSALGGTSSLVSVEALQEFRVETSSFAPEFGSSSGGQVILTTRSGSNDLHGGIYEYFRNNVMDANDWFANAAGAGRAPERHNDFGGFLGGPLRKDRTFFFFSYEGARLRLPQTSVIQVPSVNARASAPSALQPYLKVYPLPNGAVSASGFTAQFTGAYSNKATLNATSIRIDHRFSDRFSLFGRYNEAPSSTINRGYALTTQKSTQVDTRTATIGFNMLFSSRLANSIRANFSSQGANGNDAFDQFGGASLSSPSVFLGDLSPANTSMFFTINGAATVAFGPIVKNRTRQANVVDDLTIMFGRHRLQVGGDYRAIFLNGSPSRYGLYYSVTSVQQLLSSAQASLSALGILPARLLTQTFSLYGQDTWSLSPRLTLTYGMRWELSPAPKALGNTQLAAWDNVDDPGQIALAPAGSSVWKTTYGNFAPRIGAAYKLTDNGDLVLRAGAGIFYDLGLGSSAGLTTAFPNLASTYSPHVTLPSANLSPYLPPTPSLQPPFPDGVYAFSRDLSLPRSYQWNVALEKSFGAKQVLLLTYLGQAGRDLLRQEALSNPNANFSGDFVFTGNTARSNYNALQAQYRRPLTGRFQALLSYSLSHSLDNASNDIVAAISNTVISAANDYASSSFDVRQSFSGALTYAVPTVSRSGFLAMLTKDWSVDTVVVARTGLPLNGIVYFASPDYSGFAFSRPDHVSGQPYWITNAAAAGGKSLNPLAFSVPSVPRQGTEGRNDIQGFGLTQVDLSLGRRFPIKDRLQLQFHADAFNVFNHPNFTNPGALVEFGPYYRESHSMLNQGLGGLNPLFQEGGPRSLQLSLKLTF
jgi:hypothetical protein